MEGQTRQTRVNSFGTYLRTVQTESPSKDPQVKLLKLLVRGPKFLRELPAESGLEIPEFLSTLKKLQDLHLVQVTSESQGEVVNLTATGAEVAAKAE